MIKTINYILFVPAAIALFLIIMLWFPGIIIFFITMTIIILNLFISAIVNPHSRIIKLIHLTFPSLQILLFYTGLYQTAGFDILLIAQYLLMMIIAIATSVYLYKAKYRTVAYDSGYGSEMEQD